MAIFAIIQQPGANAEKLDPALRNFGDGKVLDVGHGTWLIASSGTAQDVSNNVGITSGEGGSAVVLEVASYFGRANPAIWSWIKANWETPPGG